MKRIIAIIFFFLLHVQAVLGNDISASMKFSIYSPCAGNASACGVTILAEGTIDTQTDILFLDFLSKKEAHDPPLPPSPRICFNSPGGSLFGGIKLGNIIRKRGFDTCLSPTYSKLPNGTLYEEVFRDNVVCASACVLAFSGGVNREVEKGSRIGVHQFASRGNQINEGDTQVTVVAIAAYLEKMGISRELLDIASLIPPNEIYWLTDTQAKILGVDNNQSIASGWNLEATDEGKVFVRFSQELPGNRNNLILFFSSDNDKIILTLIMNINKPTPEKIQKGLSALNGKYSDGIYNIINLHVDGKRLSSYKAAWKSIAESGFAASVTLTKNDLKHLMTGKTMRISSSVARAESAFDPSADVTLEGLSKYLWALRKN